VEGPQICDIWGASAKRKRGPKYRRFGEGPHRSVAAEWFIRDARVWGGAKYYPPPVSY